MPENEITKQKSKVPFYMLRGLAIFAIFMAIKSLMMLEAFIFYSSSNGELEEFPNWAIFLTVAVGDGFILSSIFNFFTTYDKKVMKRYLDSINMLSKGPNLIISSKHIIPSCEFLTETLTCTALLFIAQLFKGLYEFGGIFAETGAPPFLIYIIPFFFIVPLTFLSSFLSRTEVFRYWHYLDRTGELQKVESVPRMIIKAVLIFVLYVFIFPLSPIALMLFFSIFAILWVLIDFFTVIGAIALMILIPTATVGIMILRALSIRKKLFKRLRAAAEYSGTAVCEIQNPFKSLFNSKIECYFTLKKDGKIYSCRVIGTFWQRAPFFITTARHAYYRHRIGTKEHNITMYSNIEYGFDKEGKKIVILNPVPRKIYAAHDKYSEPPPIDEGRLSSVLRRTSNRKKESARKIEPADKVFDYVIYNSTAFVGAVERQCLDRHNGMFE